MLKRLHIKNFSLIRDIVVNFEDDFSVITGETGSGKSLMLNALATLVGGKIKYSSFTNADKKTIIEGQFILNDSYKILKLLLPFLGLNQNLQYQCSQYQYIFYPCVLLFFHL